MTNERDLESSSEIEFTIKIVVSVDHMSQQYRNRLLEKLLSDDITTNNAMDVTGEEFAKDFVQRQLRQEASEGYGNSLIRIRDIEQTTMVTGKAPLPKLRW